jgi:invasion protein IalB
MTKKIWQSSAFALLGAGAIFCAAVFPDAASAQAKKKSDPSEQAVLLGQFGDWGAYTASPGGKKVCFALSKPTQATTEPAGRNRDASYAFISTRPAEKVKNEVSVIVGYPQKPSHDASATVGAASYVMYTQNDGAWVKNAAEEAQMVEAMRKGADLVVKSESARGTKSTDTYSLKGIGEALDKVAAECK